MSSKSATTSCSNFAAYCSSRAAGRCLAVMESVLLPHAGSNAAHDPDGALPQPDCSSESCSCGAITRTRCPACKTLRCACAHPLLSVCCHPHHRIMAHCHATPQAHNGSGKTTCFTLGMLGRVDPKLNAPQVCSLSSNPFLPLEVAARALIPPSPSCSGQALCVCPTRELVVQNQMVLERMGKFTGGFVRQPSGTRLLVRWRCVVAAVPLAVLRRCDGPKGAASFESPIRFLPPCRHHMHVHCSR